MDESNAQPKRVWHPGREKGVLNHSKREFLAALKAHNFNVAEAMLDIYTKAMNVFENGDPADAMQGLKIAAGMVSDISDRVLPKLKAVEVKGESKFAGMDRNQKIAALKQMLIDLEQEEPTPLQIEEKNG